MVVLMSCADNSRLLNLLPFELSCIVTGYTEKNCLVRFLLRSLGQVCWREKDADEFNRSFAEFNVTKRLCSQKKTFFAAIQLPDEPSAGRQVVEKQHVGRRAISKTVHWNSVWSFVSQGAGSV